jgi:parvulin-like peptidyl-prolyl isomerase
MIRRSQPLLPLLLLPLALLATGLAGCKQGAQSEPAAAQKNDPAAPTPAQQGQAAGTSPASDALPASGMPPLGGTPAPAATPVDPAKLPDVVARINGQEIKKDELLKGAAEMRQQLAQMQGVQAPLNSQFYKQVLDSLVARTLLQQEAKAENVTVSEEEVNQQVNALRSRAPNPEAFQKALAANGLTEEKLRQQIRREGVVQKLVQTKVLAGLAVSDQQAKDFYDKNPDKMKRPERLHLRQLVVEVDPKAPAADKEKAKTEAQGLQSRVQKGEDMTKVAGEGSAKVHTGDAWIVRGQVPPVLETAAFALTKPNDVSPVLETPIGYQVLQLIAREPAAVAPFDMVKGQITEFLKQRQSQEKLAAHVQELRSKGKVETFI